MKNKGETVTLIVMILIIIILFTILGNLTISYAESEGTFKANLSTSKTILKAGEEVIVTIGVSDINMGTNGINTLEGKISYDTSIFETISSNSIQSLNNWTTTYNDESSSLNGKFLAVNLSSGTKENTSIFSVIFKVKLTITESKDTQIEFKDITSNDGTNLVKIGNTSIILKINDESSNIDNNTEKTKNNITNISNSNSETTIKNKVTNTNDNTTAKSILPKAGKSIVIVSTMLILISIVVALGIKNRTMRDIK